MSVYLFVYINVCLICVCVCMKGYRIYHTLFGWTEFVALGGLRLRERDWPLTVLSTTPALSNIYTSLNEDISKTLSHKATCFLAAKFSFWT